jgi:HSP20 family protein
MTNTELQKTTPTKPATTESTERGADTRALLPRVDVFEDDRGITLLADLPGVPRDQLDIKVDGDTLTIEGGVATTTPAGLQAAYVELRVPRYVKARR